MLAPMRPRPTIPNCISKPPVPFLLYHDAVIFELTPERGRILVMNDQHTRAPRALHVDLPVVDEQRLLRSPLRDLQGHSIDRVVRLSDTEITGTQKYGKIIAQAKSLDTVKVQFPRFV